MASRLLHEKQAAAASCHGSQRQAVPPVDYYLQQQRLRDIEEQRRQQQLQLDALRRQQTIDRINTPCVPVSAWRC